MEANSTKITSQQCVIVSQLDGKHAPFEAICSVQADKTGAHATADMWDVRTFSHNENHVALIAFRYPLRTCLFFCQHFSPNDKEMEILPTPVGFSAHSKTRRKSKRTYK